MYNETTGVETSDKSINNLKTSLIFQNIDKIYLGGYMQGIITYTNGDLDLSGSSSDYNTDQGSSGAKTDGSFNKNNLQFLRIQLNP